MIDPVNDRNIKKTKIILAALKAYSDYGITKATTRQVAEIAGIGKSTIFEYFKNTEELKQEAFLYLFKTNLDSKKEIQKIALEDPLQAINMLVDNNIKITINHPETLLFITQYSFDIFIKSNRLEGAKTEYKAKVIENYGDIEDEISMIVRCGVEKGVFKPLTERPEKAIYIVRSLIREIQTQAFVKDKEELQRVCNLIKDTIYEILGLESS